MEGQTSHQELVDGLVKEYAKIERLAASILQDKQQVTGLHADTIS